ncbi:MAG: hypothetical protein WA720_14525, partial [Pseudolabrys sp.]
SSISRAELRKPIITRQVLIGLVSNVRYWHLRTSACALRSGHFDALIPLLAANAYGEQWNVS